MGLHSYYVKYIERGGHIARRLVMATSSAKARDKASESGCEDILGARPARFFTRLFTCLAVIAAIAVLVAILMKFSV